MRRRHGSAEEEAEVNMTPMLDVVFIMLIFFIVTASFVKESGVDVNRQYASTAQPKESANIFIAITADNQICSTSGGWTRARSAPISSVFMRRTRRARS